MTKISRFLYVFGLCLFAASLPLSKTFLTISQVALGVSWLLNFNYKEKINHFKENRILWWFPGLMILHFVFLFNTDDYKYAFHDINIKIPLFLVSFVVASTAKPSKKEFLWTIGFFCAAVLAGALIVIGKHFASEAGWIEKILDHRQLSTFTSHIRFSLMICFTIAVLCFAWKEKLISGWLCLLPCLPLLYCMVLLQAITGLITLGALAFPLAMMLIEWEIKKNLKTIALATLLIVCTIGSYLYYEINDIFVPKENQEIATKTALGNPYSHDLTNTFKENGYYISRNISITELQQNWDSHSAFPYYSLDKKGQPVSGTLIRYLSSLGLKKDAQGIQQLSPDDIANIENGEANATNVKTNPVRKRIRELLWEIDMYYSGAEVDHNSLTQRFIYWKTGVEILQENYLFGVGSGDVQAAFNAQYDQDKATLKGELRRHTHNQFLTFWISFGLVGFLFFTIMLISLYRYTRHLEYSFLAKIFMIIIVLSMFSEDTLETQAGVSFFVFFFSLFWVEKKNA
ncbi:MAG: O-antigen ligase family protein [Bacteroidetes bacterium]|nr:O-antigen ligase family protein [Bacteroidota bacterium]